MAPRQPFLWVNMDSRGRSDSSARQTSNIKSHCAQYYYQAHREKLWAASDDLEVPDPTLVGSTKRSSGWHSQYTEQDQVAAQFHHALVSSFETSDLEARFEQSTRPTNGHRPGMKKRNAQQWRKVRCTRFRKQPISSVPKTDFLSISPEVLESLPTRMDSYAFDMLKFFYTALLPALVPGKDSAVGIRDHYFDAMLSDPLQLSLCMTWLFTRAVFPCPQHSNSNSPIDYDEASPIRHTLYLYKLSTIALIRHRLSEPSSIRDQTILLGIITLANCTFIADSPAEGRLHLDACLEIARARGGLATLSELELDQMCMAEFSIAALTGGIPCTSIRELAAAVKSKIATARNSAGLTGSGLAKLECLHAHHASEIREGLANLLDTTTRINETATLPSKPEISENLILRGVFAGLQLCGTQQPHAEHRSSPATEIDLCEPLRVAGILAVAMTCMRKTPNEHLLDRLTKSIALKLQQVHISGYFPSRETLVSMLWICFMGGYGASGSRRMYFLQRIAQLLPLLDLGTWKAVRDDLKRFPYVDNDFDGPLERVFNSAASWSGSTY